MKPSTAKAKGRETENDYVEFVSAFTNLPLERRRLNGVLDKGDIAGFPDVCVEVKSGAVLDVPKWMRELEVEVRNSGARMGQIAVRPKGKPNPADWWAMRPLVNDLILLGEAGYWKLPF
jgi:hypothetical protein